jgi:hypothetical protein
MPRIRKLSDDEVRRRRTAAQHLHRPRRRSAVDLVRHLTGIQAQSLPAARLAFPARADGLTAERVDRARLRERSIVRTWVMRGTLYLIAAEDYGWLVPLVVEPRIPNAFRRLEQEGVPSDQPAKAVRLIRRMLGREGPLTRPEIAERLRSGRIRTEGQALVHLLWLASAKGVICRGPERGRDQCFVLVRDWIGEPEPMERDVALGELAVRFLKAHGPATPADLAMWSGIRVGDARRAWAGIGDRLLEVETGRGAMWSLRRSAAEAPAGVVRLIPWWDEYLLGWKDRDLGGAASSVEEDQPRRRRVAEPDHPRRWAGSRNVDHRADAEGPPRRGPALLASVADDSPRHPARGRAPLGLSECSCQAGLPRQSLAREFRVRSSGSQTCIS